MGGSGRIDETDIKIKGDWKYLYRAVDKQGKAVDFLLTAKHDKAAAKRFFDKAMQANNIPEKVTMDKSGTNKAAIDEINVGRKTPIMVRQVKYLSNIVEQDHRAVKRVTKPMRNFKSFQAAKCVLASIELMHMTRKDQLMLEGCNEMSFADQFYVLAGQIRPARGTWIHPRQHHVHQGLTRQNPISCAHVTRAHAYRATRQSTAALSDACRFAQWQQGLRRTGSGGHRCC